MTGSVPVLEALGSEARVAEKSVMIVERMWCNPDEIVKWHFVTVGNHYSDTVDVM